MSTAAAERTLPTPFPPPRQLHATSGWPDFRSTPSRYHRSYSAIPKVPTMEGASATTTMHQIHHQIDRHSPPERNAAGTFSRNRTFADLLASLRSAEGHLDEVRARSCMTLSLLRVRDTGGQERLPAADTACHSPRRG